MPSQLTSHVKKNKSREVLKLLKILLHCHFGKGISFFVGGTEFASGQNHQDRKPCRRITEALRYVKA